ncbi:hypothetical protein ACISON_00515, partial [Campylobacter jejuni]
MWNLDEKKLQEMLDGFLNFQEVWTLEKVKNMTLEEYTNIKKDNPNRDDFTFWIESKLDNLGSIWGGSAFKFGIYRRNDESQKESSSGRLYSQNYAWIAKYGNNENEAFNNIKEKIIQIIQASQDNNLKTIEKIDFGDAIKWKIAFHYQDVKNIKIVNIFSKIVLDLISLNKFKEKLKIYQIHKKLLENKNLSLVKMIENIADFRDRFNGDFIMEILVIKDLNENEEAFEALNQAVKKIMPLRVDLSTIDRPPAYAVKKVSEEKLLELSKLIDSTPVL